jgi:hypothetical protein
VIVCLGSTRAICQQQPGAEAVAVSASYQEGLLFVTAQNAVLADVLGEIKRVTGANITMPPGVMERVVVRLGPEPAARVIAELLYGSRYNYVIAGTDTNPPGIESVYLTVQAPESVDQASAPASVDPPTQSQSQTKADLTGGDEGVWDNVEIPRLIPGFAERPSSEGEAKPPPTAH